MKRYLHVLVEPRAYLNALYMLIAFPLGLTYFLILTAGMVFGAFLSIMVVGLLILLATIVAAWGFAIFERELAIGLLGVNVAPLSLPDPDIVSPWRMLVRHLRQPATWRSLVYLFLKLPFGIFATVLSAVLLGTTLTGIIYPLVRVNLDGPTPQTIGVVIFPGLFCFAALPLALHVLNFIGRAWGRFAAEMLGVDEGQRQVWEAKRKAEAADRSRRDLIMNVSHELRTPIASIQAHVDSLLLPEAERPDADESERRLRVTAAETRRLADLIEDLLMLARADSHELKVTSRPVELAPIVEQVALALAPLARSERSVTVNVEEQAAHIWAVADPDRLAQVLTNLVRNAINYTPEGGVVSIRVDGGGADHVQVAVSDTGPGIPATDLEHIFERFYRADTSRARNTGGYGLGLSIARELLEAMGGSLSATSQPGLGSTFWITLRRATPRPQQ
ncbi:MAG TPA: ATP-binding protein [Candidatus Sulfotelmatobacter sp.]|nr:ATP-binding protein [Candidatus Sulfotelmatobacter sp.]